MTTNPHTVQPNKRNFEFMGVLCSVYDKNYYYPFKIFRAGFVARLPFGDHRWVEMHCAPSIMFFQMAVSTSWEKEWAREDKELDGIEEYLDQQQKKGV